MKVETINERMTVAPGFFIIKHLIVNLILGVNP